MKPLQQVIDGKIYNTETATRVCSLDCSVYPHNFAYHETYLFRTKSGRWFLAGFGGPSSMWRSPAPGGGWGGGSGIRPVTPAEAQTYAELECMDPDDMRAAGFTIEEG